MARIKVKSKISSKTGTMEEANFDASKYERQSDRLLGGAFPIAGGILGGLGGGVAGAPLAGVGAFPGAVGGAAVGAGAGSAIEQSLESLLGRQTKAPMQQLGETGTEMAMAGGGEAVGLGALRGLSPIKSLLSRALPLKAIKSLFPQTGKLAQQAVKRQVQYGTKPLVEEAFEKGVKVPIGSGGKILGSVNAALKTAQSSVDDAVKNIPKTKTISLDKALDSVIQLADNASQAGDETTVKSLMKWMINIEKKYVNKNLPVEKAMDLRRLLDKEAASTFSSAASELTMTKKAAQRTLADALRNQLREIPELATALEEEHLYLKLFESGTKELSKRLGRGASKEIVGFPRSLLQPFATPEAMSGVAGVSQRLGSMIPGQNVGGALLRGLSQTGARAFR